MADTAAEYDPRYLGGILFFNMRDFFEAHEVWESIWLDCAGPERRLSPWMKRRSGLGKHLARLRRTRAALHPGAHSSGRGPLPFRQRQPARRRQTLQDRPGLHGGL